VVRILFCLLFLTSGCSSCDRWVCTKSEVERVWHDGYTTYMVVDEVTFPIEFPGHYSDDEVCLHWRDEGKK
jgi:hypothetical protein